MNYIPRSTKRHPWWSVIGPWPIRPGLLTAVCLLYYLAYRAGAQGSVLLLEPASVTQTFIPGILGAAAVYVVALAGKQWQRRRGVHWPNFLITLVAVTAALVVFRSALLTDVRISGTGPNTVAALRLFFTFLLTSAVAGVVVRRLQDQITATQDALLIAREQQVQLITADEETRRQVALLLHDRVQAGLLSTCLELRALAPALHHDQRKTLSELGERLESIRSLDVRRAARVLSPNLDDVDLQTALEDLAGQYEAAFVTTITVTEEDDRDLGILWPFTALAIYRIVEQALLNVAAHAHATRVSVTVTRETDLFTVEIQDDGVGLVDSPRPGLGTTLITAWARAVDGAWTFEPNHGGPGTKISALLRPRSEAQTARSSSGVPLIGTVVPHSGPAI